MNKKCWKSIGPDGELNSSQRPFSKAHDMENTTTSLCVSFVILTWNSESYIKSCICSIVLALENSPLSYEIFIVDNGSKDNTKKELNQLENLYPDLVRLIFLESNMGTTYSRNLAIKRSIGDHICIMDSDVELIPGTIEKLIQHFGNDPQAGLIAPKMVYPNKKLQKSNRLSNKPNIYERKRLCIFTKRIGSTFRI